MNEMQELVEAYEKFEEVDKNFMVDMKAKSFNVDQKLLAFVFQQMQGCTLGEFREFARAIDATAMRIIEGVPIAYTPVEDGELQRVATIVNDMVDRAAEKKLLEQSSNGANSTGNCGDSTGNSAKDSSRSSFFGRFFG